MNIYAFPSLLASYVCVLFGIIVYQKDPKNQLNRVFMLLCVSLGYVAFVEFGSRQAVDFTTALLWSKMGVLWPFVMPFLLHFVLIFTKKSRLLQSKVPYFFLYVPAFAFFVLDLTTTLISGPPKKMYWGWTYSAPENPLVYNLSSAWAFLVTALSAVLCFLYFYRTKETLERQRAKYVFMWVSIPVMAAICTEGIFPVSGIEIPELSCTASAFGVVFIQYAVWKYSLFVLTPAVAADDIVAAMSNALFLIKMDSTISQVNHAALHLLGYDEHELIDHPVERVFAAHEWEKIEKKRLHSAMGPGYISNEETTFVTKDGRMIPVLLSTSVIRDTYGTEQGIVCVGSDLTDRKQAEEAHKKETLLKEIHHRVKNNFQIISSLLRLQSDYIADEQYKEMIRESQNRIKSMALIHEKLYQSENLESIDSSEYITDMVQKLVRSYSGQTITVRIEVDTIPLEMDTAVPCGLIINELVSNALKYAFPSKRGEIKVGFRAVNSTIELVVSDNGVGIPDTVDFRTTETLGLRLVTILAEDQLNGEIKLIKDRGTEFCITFNR